MRGCLSDLVICMGGQVVVVPVAAPTAKKR